MQQPNPTFIKTAIISNNQSFSYSNLQIASDQFAYELLAGQTDLAEARVAFMVAPGFDYVRVQRGIWLAGGVAVPLCTSHPLASLQYVIEDTQAEIVVVSAEFEPVLGQYIVQKGLRFLVLGHPETAFTGVLPNITLDRRAMILYTSGTTNLPKGVVTTHANIDAQVSTLVRAWEYSEYDNTLCILPLHMFTALSTWWVVRFGRVAQSSFCPISLPKPFSTGF